jgi:probable HAF family extracellular repeat protein
VAHAINSTGQVAGLSFLANGASHAFVFSNGMYDLGTLGGTTSIATSINNSGQVVGYSDTAGNTATHAFFYDGATMHDLGTLGGTSSYAASLNNAGQVAGDSQTAGDAAQHAFVYEGTTLLGTATLSNGYASIQTTALPVGSNSITVVYGGDGNFVGTTSAALAITIKQASTTTELSASNATAANGTPMTLTATVLPERPGSGTPTGTVSFWDGSTLLGTVNLNDGGVAKLTYKFSVIGKHKITAVYNGDANFLTGTSAVLTETIT